VVNTQRRFTGEYRGKLMVICGERPACCEILLLLDHLEEICRWLSWKTVRGSRLSFFSALGNIKTGSEELTEHSIAGMRVL